MKNSKFYIGVAVVALIATTAIVASSVDAANNLESEKCKFGEKHENFKIALESGNYADLGESPKITEDNFNKIVAVFQENGHQGAKEATKELNLFKNKKDFHKFGKDKAKSKHKNFIQALKNNDYASLGENPKVSQEDFNKMVEAYEKDGLKGLKEIKKELWASIKG